MALVFLCAAAVPALFHLGGDGVFDTFHPYQECLCTAKFQVNVEAHGDVVGIVGDIEVDDFLEALVVLVLHIRQLQASVGMSVVGLDVCSDSGHADYYQP